MEGITKEEEEDLDLYLIISITTPKMEIFNAVVFGAKISTKDLTFNFLHYEGKSRWIICQYTSKSKNWILHVGHY
jgi:hypothetical protein